MNRRIDGSKWLYSFSDKFRNRRRRAIDPYSSATNNANKIPTNQPKVITLNNTTATNSSATNTRCNDMTSISRFSRINALAASLLFNSARRFSSNLLNLLAAGLMEVKINNKIKVNIVKIIKKVFILSLL